MFVCKRCNSTFHIKTNLIRHLRRKNVCAILNEDIDRDIYINELAHIHDNKTNKCKYCNKGFSAPSNQYRHEKRCAIDQLNLSKLVVTLQQQLKNANQENEELKNRAKLESIVNNTYTNNITNHITNNISYGNENDLASLSSSSRRLKKA